MRAARRHLVIALAVLIGLAAIAVVGYRVFAPAEIQTTADAPYPPIRRARPGITGELARAPLIVDGRLRVYAARRQVWADTPISTRMEATPYWSLRRWPYQLVGVVAAPGPLVVSKWSDGTLVAIHARTGATAWRARSPADGDGYTGGRTGAPTLYQPRDLYTGRAKDGRLVIVSAGSGAVAALDSADGTLLWRMSGTGLCTRDAFTGPGFLAAPDRCGGPAALRRYDLATGGPRGDWRPPAAHGGWQIVPLGCATGRSECTTARTHRADGVDEGWLLAEDLVAAPALAPPGTWPVGDLAVGQGDDRAGVAELDARSLRDGTVRWTWRAPQGSADRSRVRIVAVERSAIYLVSDRKTLVVLDPETGRELTRSPLNRLGAPTRRWTVGQVHARNRFVVVERLRDPPILDAGEHGRYLGARPVLVTGS